MTDQLKPVMEKGKAVTADILARLKKGEIVTRKLSPEDAWKNVNQTKEGTSQITVETINKINREDAN